MCKIIAIMNEKGGVGKTATATALAYCLAKRKKRVLLVDFDGQGHASIICGVENPNQLKFTISSLLSSIISNEQLPEKEAYIIKNPNGVDLIPANSQLFTMERNLCNVDFRETKLLDFFVAAGLRDCYDYIIIDCMPQIGTPMINVMMCADSIIIPTQSEILSAQGLSILMQHCETIKKNSNHNLQIEGILITMDTAKTLVSSQVREMINDSFNGNVTVFETIIPRSIKVAEACLFGQSICEYKKDNSAALAYEKLTDEILNKEANQNGSSIKAEN